MLKIFLVCLLVVFVRGNIPESAPCSDVDENACTISEIQVEPCKKPSSCKLTKGKDASIKVNFTPNFTSDNLKFGMFWATPTGDLPFADIANENTCDHTTCPIQVGQPNNFDLRLNIGKKLPNGKFNLKWKLWDELNPRQACCFLMNVELRK